MASTSGTSSTSTASMLGVTGKGIGGLVSGLDTDSLVSALTSGTQSKIAKQGQQKQLLNWKMTAYRTMTSALNAFQSKFLKRNTSSSSSIMDITQNDFFNTFKATSSSSKVSVSATSASTVGNFTIDKVQQLAEAEKYTSVNKLSTTLSTGINANTTLKKGDLTGQTLKLEVDGFSTKTIKLDDLNKYLDENGGFNNLTYTIDTGEIDGNGDAITVEGNAFEAFQSELQKLLNNAYGTKTVTETRPTTVTDHEGNSWESTEQVSKKVGIVQVKLDGADGLSGNIMLDSDSAKIIVNTKNDLLGLKAGATNRVDTKTKIGDIDAFRDVQGNTLSFKINGVEISVNKDDTISALMTKINNSTAGARMEYDKFSDVFTLTSKTTGAGTNIEISDVHGNLMNQLFGVQGGSGIGTGLLTTGDSITAGAADFSKADKNSLSNMSFSLTINGVSKVVKLDTTSISSKLSSGTYTMDDIYSAINKSIQNSFYDSGVTFSRDASGKTVISSSKGEAFSVTASGKFADMTGVSGTNGNVINDYGYSKTIDTTNVNYINPASLGLTQSNPSASFEMTINGVTKTVTVSLDERNPTEEEKAADDFDPNKKLYSEINGEVFVARLNQAVKATFGDDAANVKFKANYEYNYQSINDNNGLEDTEFAFDADAWKNLSAEAKADGVDVLFDEDNNAIGKIVGETKDGVYILEYIGDDELPVRTLVDKEGNLLDNNGKKITKSVTGIKLTLDTGDTAQPVTTSVSLSGNFITTLGFASNNVNNASASAGIKLSELKGGANISDEKYATEVNENGKYELTVNNRTVEYDANTTLNDLLTRLNDVLGVTGDAGIKNGKLYINSTSNTINITDSGGMLEGIFGITGGRYETAGVSNDIIHTAGKNAEIVINGKVVPFASNNITYNGVNITLKEVSDEAIKIGVESDPDDVISRLKEWMTDYNALVYTLNSAINESKNNDYAPLTDEQKSSMTQDQIKTWETEAKKGLLRNDQTLRGILADMRSVFNQKVEAAGISLYDIGIVTKSGLSDPNEAGQLEFDSNITGGGEQRLRQMLTDNPDKVRLLFTGENGIGSKLNSIITSAASTSSVNRGSLVRIAGTEQLTGDNTSTLGNKISQIDKYVAALKSRLETEYARYWKKFSSLETSVNKMNSQSSWLQSQ